MGRRSEDGVACRHGAEEARLATVDGSLEGAGSLDCCSMKSLSVVLGLAPGRFASYLIFSTNFAVFIKQPISDDAMEGRHPTLLLSASCVSDVGRSDS